MGRRSERLGRHGQVAVDGTVENDVIQVVSRAFDVMRCFEGYESRLGNLEIANRCRLPRSTVSRLTHTLTRMGQLVYLPQDQKYRLGPGAVAMGSQMMRGLRFRALVRMRMQEMAERIPGTIGLVAPDRFHMVYLEYARAYDAVGLQSTTGSRIEIARTAAGHGYTAALHPDAYAALMADMEREIPQDAKLLQPRIEANRRSLRDNGYVISCGLWNPHINGISVPIWSPQYRDYLVITVGLLAGMYDEARMRVEVAPELLKLSRAVIGMSDSVEDNPFVEAPSARPIRKGPSIVAGVREMRNELEAGAGRADAAASLRAADGRRRESQAAT
ncbi:helix-turn-helix domain-containing protein [Bradyrhizobium sp. U87765 SZCCT0131]|uniref:IclR family transcriptional regulator n=1 Tax=unclassified Bradyrhizobium TaxID=2631580 RepID=UPI001BAB8836|nr:MULTISPECIES: helix-turn-helix domain-containing protein [unclassified Bradyrhizobium]MBR1222682.1 helix-turn-helix domain-containing protein [Bradyrhizobium sp. U87765 SZCCT0131]MBR1265237.1 helix-turn-helix domain-containing protein [Bradyrhizobium sp. U87765 SZCCT0134]MBR1302984.1 helix-turn-helix domain-containing protein [Bradyrhizobium sp. U87765 SZCCT0110]MBR1323682.1 helix-turn-helix domain-containing protein [Bradyrhizobium sp. U87765 SZCCT0109]MBR1346913.1 helix-turn-helix domain-